MAATPSVRIVKQTPYKGGTKQWSNRYHFSGGTPADLSHWTTFVNAVWTAEKAALSDDTSGVEAICYAAGSDLPLHTITISGSGSIAAGGSVASSPLEVSALLRWSTDQRTSKNHPIYLFSYIRAAYRQVDLGREHLATSQRTALGTYGSAWVTGFSDGTTTYHRAGPNGAVGLGQLVNLYVTHRDFPN
jgi:hypothetical protein